MRRVKERRLRGEAKTFGCATGGDDGGDDDRRCFACFCSAGGPAAVLRRIRRVLLFDPLSDGPLLT